MLAPIFGYSSGHYPRKRVTRVHSLLTQVRKIRTLIDTAASVFVIREDRHKGLRPRGWLRRRDIEISQVDRKTMTIVGMVRLPVKIIGMNSVHKLYVTPDERESKKSILQAC